MKSFNPVIVIPSHIERNDYYSKISINHLKKYLNNYRIVLLLPSNLKWSISGIENIYIPNSYFGSIHNYNKLQLSSFFYNIFSDHSHILIYHFDSLVFKDELEYWCHQPIDYIGASWYPDKIRKVTGFEWPYANLGCGNGGFSLRRVDSFIRHLENRRRIDIEILRNVSRLNLKKLYMIWNYRMHLDPNNYQQHETLNEDVYFGIFAPLMDVNFRVAEACDGDKFSFEYDPDFLYEKNDCELPFGCHAWYKNKDSLQFWERFLIK